MFAWKYLLWLFDRKKLNFKVIPHPCFYPTSINWPIWWIEMLFQFHWKIVAFTSARMSKQVLCNLECGLTSVAILLIHSLELSKKEFFVKFIHADYNENSITSLCICMADIINVSLSFTSLRSEERFGEKKFPFNHCLNSWF